MEKPNHHPKVEISEEQQLLLKNKSIVDTVLITRQITEKSTEYGKPTLLCFIVLTNTLDNV